jgi:hypothetical protein
MSLPGSNHDREYQKFRNSENGTSIAVTSDSSLNVETAGVQWDEIITTFPATNVEVFTYRLSGNVVQTVTVTYESSAKKTPVSVVRVRL